VRAGTYNEYLSFNNTQGGSSEATRTIVKAHTGETVTITPVGSNLHIIDFFSSKGSWITFDGFVVNGTGMSSTDSTAVKLTYNTSSDAATHIRIQNCDIKNVNSGGYNQGILVDLYATNAEILHNHVHLIGPQTGTGTNLDHAIYIAGPNATVAWNELDHIADGTLQIYSSGSSTATNNAIVHHNYLHDGNVINAGHTAVTLSSGSNILAYDNVIEGGGVDLSSDGIRVYPTCSNCKVYNNTINAITNGAECAGGCGIYVAAGASSTVVGNNEITGSGVGISNNGSSTTLTTNRTSDSAGTVFVASASHDYNLVAGQAAIGGGSTITGNSHVCVSTCDVGALEQPAFLSATTQSATVIRVTWTVGQAPITCSTGSVGSEFGARDNTVALNPTACAVVGNAAVDLTVSTMTAGHTIDVSCKLQGCIQDGSNIGNYTTSTGNARAESLVAPLRSACSSRAAPSFG